MKITVSRVVAGMISSGLVASALASSAGAGVVAQRTRHSARAQSLTMLEDSSYAGNWSQGLNPLTAPNNVAQASMMNAIYGELFEIGKGGKLVDDLATGYRFANKSRVLAVTLRHGVTFTDGSPFDAAAVAYNWRHDIANKGGSASPGWPSATVSTSGKYTVVLHFRTPDSAALDSFQDSTANWIISPTDVKKHGKVASGLRPVGAGPFEVVSDSLNSKLVLKRNPNYWQKGHPYLEHLTFLPVNGDENALEDMQSGDGQAYEFMSTPKLIPGFKGQGYTVTKDVEGQPLTVSFNTLTPPFNKLRAREAVSYATNASALDKLLYNGTAPLTESFTTSTDLFYNPKVPGFRSYNLAKAKALVKQLGGLSFNIFTLAKGNSLDALEALQAMYQDAGMKVTISNDPVSAGVPFWQSGKWQAEMGTIGDWDPAKELQEHLGYGESFSGVKDKHLQALLDAAITVSARSARGRIYNRLASYLNKMDYYVFLFANVSYDVAAKGVSGPGLTSELPGFQAGPQILWQDVRAKR